MLSTPRTLLALLAGVLSAAAAAQGRASAGESPFFEDLPTVLSASRLPQVLHEAPGAVTILDRDFIRATGYRDVARLLRLVPGMQIGQERGHGQWVTYHGLGSDFPSEIQVLIDGRSVYAPSSFGGVDWSGLSLTVDEIERIEVVRGTNSNAFGANAFLGVINIITRHSQQDRGSRGQVNLGNHGIADLQAAWSGGSDDLGVRISAVQTRDNGFTGVHDSRLSQVLSLRSDYRLDARNELTLRAGYNKSERGLGYPDSIFDNNAVRTSSTTDYSLHLTWRHSIGEDEEWLASFYHNRQSGIDRWLANGMGFQNVPLSRGTDSRRSNAELQHRFTLTPQARLVWGVEGRQDEANSPGLFAGGNPPPHELYRAFSNLDWRLTPAWQLNLGALVEKNGAAATQFIPRVFLNWQASATDTFRAGYSRAWQQRNLFEVYGDVRVFDPKGAPGEILIARPYAPNPDLRIPHVDTVELGYLGRFPSIDATLDVRVFNERISDFVIRQRLQSSPEKNLPPPRLPLPISQFTNLDSAVELRGIEYQLRARPWRGGELLLSHTLIDRRMKEEEIRQRTSPYSASLTWLQSYPAGWTSTASLLRMGQLAGGYGYVPGCETTSKPYTTFDMRIARAFRFEGRKAEVALNGINLGGPHQEIVDRSEQCLPANQGKPVNPASSMVWMSLSIEL